MDTTVTRLFPDRSSATQATARLLAAGYRREQIRIVDAETPDRHQFLRSRSADQKRAVVFGVVFGAVGGTLAGALLASVLDLAAAALAGGVAVAIGGALLGLAVGRSTATQVQQELETKLDGGSVVVSLVTDAAQGEAAIAHLTDAGSVSVVSTATTFTARAQPENPTGA